MNIPRPQIKKEKLYYGLVKKTSTDRNKAMVENTAYITKSD